MYKHQSAEVSAYKDEVVPFVTSTVNMSASTVSVQSETPQQKDILDLNVV